jgi:hypothetical protein
MYFSSHFDTGIYEYCKIKCLRGDVVAQFRDVVAQWGCGGSVGMWWLRGDVVAQWGCGGKEGECVG